MNAPNLFNRGLTRLALRYLLKHLRQTLLMLAGVALGVAVVVSIDLANAASSTAFRLSTESVAGRATHSIVAGPDGVPDAVFTRLRRDAAFADYPAAPIVADTVSSPQMGDRPLQLFGIDPFADAPFRGFLSGDAGGVPDLSALGDFLTRPGALLISRPMAERYALAVDDPITLRIAGFERGAYIAGLLDPQDDLSARGMDGLLLADIATAQELLGRPAALTRIEWILPEVNPPLDALRAALPPGVRLEASAARAGSVQEMTAAFQLNLTSLSLLALVVGLFLIYNTMTFSVVQRRVLFGTLRCVGVTRREIFALVMVEALAVGVVGALLGLGLGLLLGRVTVALTTQTVNDLFFTTTVRNVPLDPSALVKGLIVGIVATLVAAALPAAEAARVSPRAALLRSEVEGRARRAVLPAALGGVGFLLLGGLLFLLPTRSLAVAFAGTLAVVLGAALFSALALTALMRLIAPFSGRAFGVVGRMAPRSLVNALSRTSVAVAALMVAVAVVIGVTLMIDSFRHTVEVWLAQTLQGDVYVSVPAFSATTATTAIDPSVVTAIEAWPGVARVDTLRAIPAEAIAPDGTALGEISLSATRNPAIGQERIFAALNGTPQEVWRELQAGEVIVSEPLANRARLRPGDLLTILTPDGAVQYPVRGVYYDYASTQGGVIMDLEVYRAAWQDDDLTALSLRLDAGIAPDALAAALQDGLPSAQSLSIRPNAALRADVMVVFDRTFAITVALRLLAVLVALMGVLNALLLLQFEKAREMGVMRALGLTREQLTALTLGETGLMGLTAGLLALPTGYVLSLILIFIINERSFGWTLQTAVSWQAFAQAMLVALGASLVAGIYPALRLRRMAAADAMRFEAD